MDSNKNFGENEMNDLLKKFNQKNKKEDDEDKNFIIPNANNENNNNNIISSFKQQIISLNNKIKSLNEMLQSKDDIIKKLQKENEILEKKIKKFKEQSFKYGGNKNKIGNMRPKIRNKTEIYNRYEVINNEQNITNNFFLNNGQQNYKYNEYNNMISRHNENNYLFNINQNMRNDYSFRCLTEKEELTKKIYEDNDDFVEFTLLLINNGPSPWPSGKTKLVFDEPIFDEENSKDIILVSQEHNQQKNYKVCFKGLKEYQTGEYISKLRFNVNGKNIGEEIVLTIIIDENYDIQKLKMEDEGNNDQLSQFKDLLYSSFAK